MEVQVEINTVGGKQKVTMSEIPQDVWNSFCERAKLVRSDVENPALAWAAALGDYIESIAATDKRTIILRDIPTNDLEALNTKAAQAGLSIPQLLAELIKSAVANKLYLGRYGIKTDGKTIRGRHSLLITNLTDKAMLPFGKLSTMSKMPIVLQFMQMFGQIEQGKVDLKIWQEDKDGNRNPIVSFEEAARNNSEETE